MSQSYASCVLHAGFLLVLFFDPEDGTDIFLRKEETQRFLPEDRSLLKHRLASLSSYVIFDGRTHVLQHGLAFCIFA
jgi:hypothetical protein